MPRINNKVRVTALRIARVEHVDEFSGRPATRVVELDVVGGHLVHAEDLLADVFSDMQLLGLRPAVFIPCRAATAPSPRVDAGLYAAATNKLGGA